MRMRFTDDISVVLGRNIQSVHHENHMIAVIVSFSDRFDIVDETGKSGRYEAALVPKDTPYELSTGHEDWAMFIHIDPYSDIGLEFNPKSRQIQELWRADFSPALEIARPWIAEDPEKEENLGPFIEAIRGPLILYCHAKNLDGRIRRCIRHIKDAEFEAADLGDLASMVGLSSSRLSHLFKQETGMTYRRFVRHAKLIRSLKTLIRHRYLTDTSYSGGFADQAHFSKVFKMSFGVTPSSVKE